MQQKQSVSQPVADGIPVAIHLLPESATHFHQRRSFNTRRGLQSCLKCKFHRAASTMLEISVLLASVSGEAELRVLSPPAVERLDLKRRSVSSQS